MSTVSWSEVATLLKGQGYQLPPFQTSGAVFTADDVIMSTGDTHAQFELASVTKLLTTWAVLRACDAGVISLEDTFPEGFTLRHLLSHASGLPREKGGKLLEAEKKRLYSNWGLERAAEHVELAVHVPFTHWVNEEVFQPLGMSRTDLYGSPAYGSRSTISDLVTFAREVLNPRLLSRNLADQARTVQFPELTGRVPGYASFSPNYWGLGLEIHGQKIHWLSEWQSPETVGHFGVAGSYLWVDPVRQAGAVFLGAEPFSSWHQENWVKLNAAIGQFLAGR